MNHVDFMKKFADRDLKTCNYIELAYIISKDAHRSQTRKSGERYFEHPRRVATILVDEIGVRDWVIICAGLLHDVVEDTLYLHYGNLVQWFGSSHDARWLAELVYDVSRKAAIDHRDPVTGMPYLPKRTQAEYYARLGDKSKSGAALVKGADSLDNVRSLEGTDYDFQKRTLAKAKKMVAILDFHTLNGPYWTRDEFARLSLLLSNEIKNREEILCA